MPRGAFLHLATIRDLTLAHIRQTNAPDRDQDYPDRRNIGQLDELEVLVRFSAVGESSSNSISSMRLDNKFAQLLFTPRSLDESRFVQKP